MEKHYTQDLEIAILLINKKNDLELIGIHETIFNTGKSVI